MASLFKNVTNAIWHAFSSLYVDQDGNVAKTKLKVLTANIGVVLDLYGVEKGLDHFRSTPNLNFHHFKYYLQKEVFSSSSCCSADVPLSILREYESKIDDICWQTCKKQFIYATKGILPEVCLFHLFRVFCLLAEFVQQNGSMKVALHVEEVSLVLSQLVASLGLDWHQTDFESITENISWFPFEKLIELLENKYVDKYMDKEAIKEAVTGIMQTFIEDVIKKGTLMKRGYLLPTLKEYWFVLKPTQLVYYKSRREEKQTCGLIPLDARCSVTSNLQRIVLRTSERNFEFATHNHRSRLQWLSSLKLAIRHSSGCLGYQRTLAARRRLQREANCIEKERRSSMIRDMGEKLEAEKMARVAAEQQAEEVKMASEKRLGHLEALLEEEIQAKRDEEIVRALQARVLREEWQKREELEQLQEEQKILLDEERQKRVEFEKRQKENDIQLLEAERKLQELELERKRLDDELCKAQSKLASLASNNSLKAENQGPGNKIRRSMSMLTSSGTSFAQK